MLTRRQFAAATLSGLCLSPTPILLGASDFWNRRPAAEWDSQEVLQLATRSPWAVGGRVLPRPGKDKGSMQPTAPDIAGGRSGGRGLGPEPVITVSELIVRWESAQPLLDALRYSFPPDFANHYVIGVVELPIARKPRREDEAHLLATLRARGKEPVDAGAVLRTSDGVMVFGFSKELLPLSGADRDVLFVLEAPQFSLRARFDPKEMIYRGMFAA